MADEDAFSSEMRRLLNDPDGSDPLALDRATAERLLAGELGPADTPPAYAGVAEVLAAAAGPPTIDELAGAAPALAAFRAARPPASPRAERGRATRTPAERRRATRRRPAPERPAGAGRLRVGLAALAVAAAVSVGGTAAAVTGNLPAPVQRLARAVLPGTMHQAPGSSPAPADRRADGQAPETTSRAPGTSTRATGPPALTGSAARGLCTAWSAGQGDTKGKQLDSASFQALATAAGGAGNIPAYCERIAPVPSGSGPGQGGSGQGGSGQGQPGGSPRDATPAAATLRELCKDYLADKTRKLDADALATLTAVAGGADQVPAYCERIAG